MTSAGFLARASFLSVTSPNRREQSSPAAFPTAPSTTLLLFVQFCPNCRQTTVNIFQSFLCKVADSTALTPFSVVIYSRLWIYAQSRTGLVCSTGEVPTLSTPAPRAEAPAFTSLKAQTESLPWAWPLGAGEAPSSSSVIDNLQREEWEAGRTGTENYPGEGESHSVVTDSVTPWTTQSIEFSRPEYWSGLPFPSPGDLPDPGIGAGSPALQADSLSAEPQRKPRTIPKFFFCRCLFFPLQLFLLAGG